MAKGSIVLAVLLFAFTAWTQEGRYAKNVRP